MKKFWLLFYILILLQTVLYSQDKKAFKKSFLEAEYFFLRGNYHEAAFLYSELVKQYPGNANLNFLAGATFLSIPGEKEKAISYLEKAVSSVSAGYREGSYKEEDAPKQSLFALARSYHINRQFSEALEYYEKYRRVVNVRNVAEVEFVKKQIESVKLAKEILKDTIQYEATFFPGEINIKSDKPVFNAVYAPGDSTLIYNAVKPFYQAIVMTKRKNGIWTEPIIINDQLKADDNCDVTGIAWDGSELYIVKNEDFNSDIYVSYYKQGKWSNMEALKPFINTEFNEKHASISKDKNTLFFSSDRPGGYGALDIYFSKKGSDGEWTEPVNIGKPINSIYSENTPFITEDDKTLYFSSMSHATMGGYDIFYSTLLPDNKWAYPANLGFPVNNTDDNTFYYPLDNGKQALYKIWGSDPDDHRLAIISQTPRENWSYTFKGKILADDNLDLNETTEVRIIEKDKNLEVATVIPDPETGEYNVDMPPGNYEVKIKSEGYDTVSENVNILAHHQVKNINIDSKLTPKEVSEGKYVISKNVLFGFDSSELSEEAKFELEKLYRLMSDNPEISVEVAGYTDSKGAADYNLRLASRRTRSVVDYLVERGISKERFISRAYGESKQFAINENPDGSDNPEGRKINRQVEINLLNTGNAEVWTEEYLVPEHLKPEALKNYYVILDESSNEISGVQKQLEGEHIKLFETGRKHIYAAGSFDTRSEAVEYLNKVIDTEYPEGRIVNESEFNYLLKPSVPDLNEVKGPFTIQLLALRNELDFNYFPVPEETRVLKTRDSINRYFYGVFEEYSSAQEELVNFILQGFTDAFILELARYNSDTLQLQIDASLSYYYTIQFSATMKPADETHFENIGEILVNKGRDGFYRNSTGIFLNRTDAEKTLKTLREMGFRDAFIKKIERKTK